MGASWKSLAASFVLAFVNYFASLGANLPKTSEDWGHVAVSAAVIAFGAVVKDWNVSNSPTPHAPTAVPPAAAATPNPAAVTPAG